jgi:hypothetical protein
MRHPKIQGAYGTVNQQLLMIPQAPSAGSQEATTEESKGYYVEILFPPSKDFAISHRDTPYGQSCKRRIYSSTGIMD